MAYRSPRYEVTVQYHTLGYETYVQPTRETQLARLTAVLVKHPRACVLRDGLLCMMIDPAQTSNDYSPEDRRIEVSVPEGG